MATAFGNVDESFQLSCPELTHDDEEVAALTSGFAESVEALQKPQRTPDQLVEHLPIFSKRWASLLLVLLCGSLAFAAELRLLRPARKSDSVSFIAPSTGDGTVFVNVQIGKSGSSTMRTLLNNYQAKRGLQYYCNLNRRGGRTGQYASLNYEVQYASLKVSPCPRVRNGSVLQGIWGDCALIKEERKEGGKETMNCRHIVVLREPVARMVSAWAYFCRDCNEEHKFCWSKDPSKKRPCPGQSFLKFVHKYNNPYTRQFARDSFEGNDLLVGGHHSGGLTDAGFSKGLTEDDFQMALHNLRSSAELVALEDPNLQQRLGNLLGHEYVQDIPHSNVNRKETHVSEAELAAAKDILHFDVRLYGSLFYPTVDSVQP